MRKQTLIAFLLMGTSLVSYAAESTTTTTNKTEPEAATAVEPIIPAKPETPPADTNNEVMSKTNWLNTIVPMLPELICKGFMGDSDLKARLDKIKMSYEQCVSVIPESVNNCQSQLSSSIPDKITNEDASIWGKHLGECIGKDFAMRHLIPKQ